MFLLLLDDLTQCFHSLAIYIGESGNLLVKVAQHDPLNCYGCGSYSPSTKQSCQCAQYESAGSAKVVAAASA